MAQSWSVRLGIEGHCIVSLSKTLYPMHSQIQTGPLENHKNIGFFSNTGLDPLKNHKVTKLAFNVGPSSACQQNTI